MRIGIFTDTYPPYINGVSTSIKMLEESLKQKGHQVYIVTVNTKNMKLSITELFLWQKIRILIMMNCLLTGCCLDDLKL